MTLNDITNEIYVLNLKKRDDRLHHIKNQLKQINITKYEIVESVDGSIIENKTKLKNGAYGLILTYLNIYEKIKNIEYESLILIEDDCVFSKDFNDYLKIFIDNVPIDWDILYFGGNHNLHIGEKEPKKINDYVVKLHNTYAAHCIILKKNSFEKLIKTQSFEVPIDMLLSKLQNTLNVYSTNKKITWQINNHSDIEERYTNYDWILKT